MKQLLMALVSLAVCGASRADVIALYTFEDQTGTNSATAANVSVSNLIYSGPATPAYYSGNNSSWGYSADKWPTDAVTNGFFVFSITPDPGYSFSLTDVTFDSRRSATGPRAYGVEFSFDGGLLWTTIESFTRNDTNTWRTAEVANDVLFSGATGAVDFRIYALSADGSAGTFRIDNVTVNGAVIPEPATGCLVGLGLLTLLAFRRRAHWANIKF